MDQSEWVYVGKVTVCRSRLIVRGRALAAACERSGRWNAGRKGGMYKEDDKLWGCDQKGGEMDNNEVDRRMILVRSSGSYHIATRVWLLSGVQQL